MIDMRGIRTDKDFLEAQKIFKKNFKTNCTKETHCHWSVFKKAFSNYSKCKCPICEDTLNKYSDIDHYRPKKAGYPFLKCCCSNYMIMCSECNRSFKNIQFPKDTDYQGTCEKTIKNEKPLLVNPVTDNIFDFFELVFMFNGENKILEIQPNSSLDPTSYEYRKAMKTIEVYGIGNCKENSKVSGCRINILEKHYEDFLEFAIAMKEGGKHEFMKLYKEREKKSEYGFIKFIAKQQFKIAI